MDAKEALYVACRKGVFILPDRVFRSLAALASGAAYVRHDDDVVTIAARKFAEAHRRPLRPRFRIPALRGARKLAIVDLKDSVQVMVVA
jgi:hypothetical protein